MRISICGPNRNGAILKAEGVLGVKSIDPCVTNEIPAIIDLAAETYNHFDDENFILDGCPFDYLSKYNDGYFDVFEQVAINSLMNLDYVVVITMDMDKDTKKMYEYYAKIYPDKFHFYSSDVDFEVTIK